ncbi:MAG: transglutaminase domain-containing protein, partial [Blautia sp.]|nr:transglutaminase domain-containing protein [Blautia sp.]
MRIFRYYRPVFVLSLCLVLLLLPGCGGGGGASMADSDPPIITPMHVLLPEAPGTKTIGIPRLMLDISNTSQGYMVAQAEDDGKTKNITMVSEKGGVSYSYFIPSGESVVIPFTDGSDTYEVSAFQQVEGSTYCALFVEKVSVSLENLYYPYLYPNQYVDFDDKTEACVLAQELLPEDTVDVEALDAIYDYVVTNVTYDYDKAATVEPGYLPDVDDTLHTRKGICFDYAALMTAMLRSRDIPCRLVIGYAG